MIFPATSTSIDHGFSTSQSVKENHLHPVRHAHSAMLQATITSCRRKKPRESRDSAVSKGSATGLLCERRNFRASWTQMDPADLSRPKLGTKKEWQKQKIWTRTWMIFREKKRPKVGNSLLNCQLLEDFNIVFNHHYRGIQQGKTLPRCSGWSHQLMMWFFLATLILARPKKPNHWIDAYLSYLMLGFQRICGLVLTNNRCLYTEFQRTLRKNILLPLGGREISQPCIDGIAMVSTCFSTRNWAKPTISRQARGCLILTWNLRIKTVSPCPLSKKKIGCPPRTVRGRPPSEVNVCNHYYPLVI